MQLVYLMSLPCTHALVFVIVMVGTLWLYLVIVMAAELVATRKILEKLLL